jgi:hypothetical protein
MVKGHMRAERGKHVTCCIGFPQHDVHRFESVQLSDMSTACLWQSSRSKLVNLMSLM